MALSQREVWATIKYLHLDKAPGPDGFTGRFYKSCWSVIKGDILMHKKSPDRPWASLPVTVLLKFQALFDVAVDAILGNGEEILFCTDRWLAQALQNRRWVHYIKGILTVDVLTDYLLIWDMVDGLVLHQNVPDQYKWKLTQNGYYSSKSLCGLLCGIHQVEETLNHLLVGFVFTSEVWNIILQQLGVLQLALHYFFWKDDWIKNVLGATNCVIGL